MSIFSTPDSAVALERRHRKKHHSDGESEDSGSFKITNGTGDKRKEGKISSQDEKDALGEQLKKIQLDIEMFDDHKRQLEVSKMNMSAEGVKESHASGSSGAKSIGVNASDSPLLPEESQKTVSGSTLRVQGEVKNSSSAALASSTSTNSVVGVYSSSSDPVHVPSPDSRTAGTVGAIRREVGAVGVRRPSSDRISAICGAYYSLVN